MTDKTTMEERVREIEEVLSWDLGDYWYERTPLEKSRVVENLSSLFTKYRDKQWIDYLQKIEEECRGAMDFDRWVEINREFGIEVDEDGKPLRHQIKDKMGLGGDIK